MPTDDDLIDELHSALAHLDDPPYLEKHPLAGRIPLVAQAQELSRGQALRRALRLAIAALDPGAPGGSAGVEARSYQVLYRYAVARQGMVAIATSLGISVRQAYRELRAATEALSQIMSSFGATDSTSHTEGKPAPLATQLHEELARLSQQSEAEVDLTRVVSEAIQSVQALARASAVELTLEASGEELHVAASRVMLRQAVLNLFSHMITVEQLQHVTVQLERTGANAVLCGIFHPPASASSSPTDPYAVATQLFRTLGLTWQRQAIGDGTTRIALSIPLAEEHSVLIVDDNEGMIALYRRYLQHQPYRVVGARSGTEALAKVEQMQPEVVILDVMMPDRDGWEVLQALRASPAGRRARVIVCSIINDPKLAQALGADAFLNKPVDRLRLLQALKGVLSSTT